MPGNVTVNRGDGPLKVTCTVNGQNGAKTVEETVDPWFAGNILLGGLIGITIDSYNGAYQHYPDEINISIVNLPQATAAGQAGAAPIMTPDVKAAPNAH